MDPYCRFQSIASNLRPARWSTPRECWSGLATSKSRRVKNEKNAKKNKIPSWTTWKIYSKVCSFPTAHLTPCTTTRIFFSTFCSFPSAYERGNADVRCAGPAGVASGHAVPWGFVCAGDRWANRDTTSDLHISYNGLSWFRAIVQVDIVLVLVAKNQAFSEERPGVLCICVCWTQWDR